MEHTKGSVMQKPRLINQSVTELPLCHLTLKVRTADRPHSLYCTPMRHLHLRKRISKNLEPYPARSAWKRLLDRVVFAAGIVGPVLTLPQIVLIYTNHDASGISAMSWFGWAALNVVWILYGLVHREPPIVMTYSFWFIANSTVAIGAVLYG